MSNKETTEVSAHGGLGEFYNKLSELWFEIGGSCHLRCDYCFAKSGGVDTCKENAGIERTLGYLDEFKKMGGERIAVVGAGEPFHARNIDDMFKVMDYTKQNNITTTIFTTGDLISPAVLDRLDNYRNIVLLVKYNSKNPGVQDNLVKSPGYTKRRDEALERLIQRGYNDGKRLGIVTSIMKANYDEMADLLRFARKSNLIFDADTLIPRGRGGECGLNLLPKETQLKLQELQNIDREEFRKVWPITGTYVASPPCTRFEHHLYIDKTGLVHPCVSSSQVVLGNVKEQSLGEIWDSALTKVIRNHSYTGKCTTCKNYQEKKCFSCLGRCTEDLNTESLKRDGCVKTTGCFNYRGENGQ